MDKELKNQLNRVFAEISRLPYMIFASPIGSDDVYRFRFHQFGRRQRDEMASGLRRRGMVTSYWGGCPNPAWLRNPSGAAG